MDPSEYLGGDQQNQKRQLQICGPRPSPLSVHKDSRKIIKKPPKHPAPPQNRDHPPPYVPREPVVIYAVSPKVVHATASEFMNVVQRLTGISSEVFLESGGGGNVSPAARLASTENASPRGGKDPVVARDDEIPTAMDEAAEFGGYAPGILSPSPAMLPTASAGIFSPIIHQGGMFSPAIPPGLFSPAGFMSPFLFSPGYNIASPTFADVFSSHFWDL
ncbi:hypothetical protein CARUB_v10015299mg [Capsella rubella]|uniref:VQ domain-containing protein n=1 Tax=Capsella rubella TaxID=81985 RepID=R0HQL9_9BRAS|nr:protein MKS1 [Capsella rubella]EOA32054.1 hypothetical protein CARUB_v10015299mg [Capsella rubella]